MPWLKRNLFLVIGGVVALALLGIATFFLISKIQANNEVTAKLQRQTELYRRLVMRNPHPNPENIEAAKQEQQKVEQFAHEVRVLFLPAAMQPTTHREFRGQLDRTVRGLTDLARRSGVDVPADFYFTFDAHKNAVSFPSLQSLSSQLSDIREICEILFDAKVHSLVAMQRTAAAEEDGIGSHYLVDIKAETNEWAVVTPYQVTFDAFSSELARIMDGLNKSRQFLVLKTVEVEPAATALSPLQRDTFSPYQSDADSMRRYGMEPGSGAGMRDPYGRGGRPGGNPYGGRGGGNPYGGRGGGYAPPSGNPFGGGTDRFGNPATTPRPAPMRPGVILDEELLRFTLRIDAVKLNSVTQAQ
jgi:hypothetical protein